ncbi:(deoxy)nucleoside triphosphate pyrophosphohydrolase [Chryseolinea soli]|uniref:8-oxo-dGTP diphosphatase n=1 Tax=Chryseolinea soli TaxID=2321403 RepID=A0A385SIC5_9BACT|nr:(deoxy)nucleoside triphosphate pyrophosphohydrolase [Chryseolinea soli]AYB30979.1 (deoxy)nucleoside triphosphate pyrophosphohydrolase [Chryseolinea soli]
MVQVACAIIENHGKVLVAQRSKEKQLGLKWEFPGGKLCEGESAEECIYREIREELGIEIEVIRPLTPTVTEQSPISIKLIPFVCKYISGPIVMNDHNAIRWVSPGFALATFDWCPADIPVVTEYLKICRS